MGCSAAALANYEHFQSCRQDGNPVLHSLRIVPHKIVGQFGFFLHRKHARHRFDSSRSPLPRAARAGQRPWTAGFQRTVAWRRPAAHRRACPSESGACRPSGPADCREGTLSSGTVSGFARPASYTEDYRDYREVAGVRVLVNAGSVRLKQGAFKRTHTKQNANTHTNHSNALLE